jgi:uncharacterized membrane protein
MRRSDMFKKAILAIVVFFAIFSVAFLFGFSSEKIVVITILSLVCSAAYFAFAYIQSKIK